jgi:hypothetical protein
MWVLPFLFVYFVVLVIARKRWNIKEVLAYSLLNRKQKRKGTCWFQETVSLKPSIQQKDFGANLEILSLFFCRDSSPGRGGASSSLPASPLLYKKILEQISRYCLFKVYFSVGIPHLVGAEHPVPSHPALYSTERFLSNSRDTVFLKFIFL